MKPQWLVKVVGLVALLSLLSTGSHAQERRPLLTWQGAYVSLNRVSPIRSMFAKPDLNLGFLVIVGIGKRYSFQVQYLQPITGSPTSLLRVGFDRRLF